MTARKSLHVEVSEEIASDLDPLDDADMDEWMAKSDAEQQAELDGAIRDYHAMIDAMSRDQYYTYRRRKRVALCLRWRRLAKQIDIPFFWEKRRAAQRMLLELRIERRTGIAPGSA